jgi:hypothetical protein
VWEVGPGQVGRTCSSSWPVQQAGALAIKLFALLVSEFAADQLKYHCQYHCQHSTGCPQICGRSDKLVRSSCMPAAVCSF